jgi:hypothetical protein
MQPRTLYLKSNDQLKDISQLPNFLSVENLPLSKKNTLNLTLVNIYIIKNSRTNRLLFNY